ncbi:transcription initiation factor TFIID subunit 5-like [Neltuma alba]|uniref:transcription initiation factor TFIID subunit 5-like n=1 Tax=Neltuma alba TaxID=207710 RepID=UPI0010A4FE5C|nr:transcription initiation factor TFIID subunit 5-like [Prosopis alba]
MAPVTKIRARLLPFLWRIVASNLINRQKFFREKQMVPSMEDQEEALVALINHRTHEVQHLRRRISYYTSKLEEAEKRLQDSKSQLARLRGQANAAPSRSCVDDITKTVKLECKSNSPIHTNKGPPIVQHNSKPKLLIPDVIPPSSQSISLQRTSEKASISTDSQSSRSLSSHAIAGAKVKEERSQEVSTDEEVSEIKYRGTKRKFEHKEHNELIPQIGSSTSLRSLRCKSSSLIPSQHKRKLRSLALCPVDDHLFATSALDGVVKLWRIQSKGSGVSLLSSTDCVSLKQRRWPEDIAWHPDGNSLYSVYTADVGESQVSVMNLNRKQVRECVNFLEDKPHSKGVINKIVFMPWEDTCFVTGGSDHAVILWSEDSEKIWRPKTLHKNLHSSAVMGVAGMQQKQVVLSAGADKRIFGFDTHVGREYFKHQIDNKCMSVLPNPCDFNLFMVQTGTPEKQLRLVDIRSRASELHAFGWKQESSESQSALINQAWSPDGLYITSGSADPVIHIFDIRYNAHKPSQSITAHQKRVFKAVWLKSVPVLISISSDLNIGLHKIK